jgi:hypothetical protein
MSTMILSSVECSKCGSFKRYRRSGRCVSCIARINAKQQVRAEVLKFDRKELESRLMENVRYENETGMLA